MKNYAASSSNPDFRLARCLSSNEEFPQVVKAGYTSSAKLSYAVAGMEYFTSPDIEQQKYELFATIKADFYIVNIYLCISLFDNAAKDAWHARMMNCLF